MKIAIASGKGGTGKTTVATNLAQLAASQGYQVAYIDCDVEAPNGHLFLRPDITSDDTVHVTVPDIDPTRCNHCGVCAHFCQFNALLCLPGEVLLFPELCHSCGGCQLICPQQCISEREREIGQCQIGKAGQVDFVSGRLNIGEAKSPPLIHQVKKQAPETDLMLIDAPPGTSCPVVESLRDCDFVVLVTEPTPFGLHDLTLAAEMVQLLGIPCGVVINRSAENDEATLAYCNSRRIPVLACLPDNRKAAEAYSRGELIAQSLPSFNQPFTTLLERLLQQTKHTGSPQQRCHP
ncbi:NTPase, 4Fe-4S-binding protein [Syntrophotalea carbinolica DSM 2380]|uniref:NTPase, 4Fe-4S-binding protein n=1 Tax=Syntrophotalea carbinolica (strain DSM 2380 / NBRC 103641 / GraBd1) TaxID=338963 RepID=Q3A6K0_SYNC1|nr:ATP-binding protein [Syntrophotalea carbinolica]ABA88007.1 NTPase, 4Fe-4S-binding protein [Syntrophotalea carbinolica DSM 2380]